ncbi:hypothetical protein EYZ11_003705 [Aspergillus tanneri]|uniref:Carboxylic ester hydrolase n=1 Tax=Aspergillus tanneri TaxID=1220188 RepID=A0A4S3JMJ8_9EURO|nr:uncharacterized protein ATNIH1004_004962 [Aspergillus tanneri]KAA8649070.1 hypothetical protein ATNIH1004_004962 [Aspergillus tanneri]THC96826.1 hypothetical protein EYZ11_003705 [Aspergillus tanneri]
MHRHPCVKSLSHRGFIQGITLFDQSTDTALCHYFGGLRYALPPSRRWRKAQKLPSNFTYGTKDKPCPCTGTSGVCPQPSFLNLSVESIWSEDCFQCNVWVPAGEPPKDGWPVLIFIHGGFLQFGTPNTFSATNLLGEAGLDAIIVMPAYRLGVFGFLYSSELQNDAASVGEPVGNQGFWDQRLALEWTKDNVSLFGGNPSQITISGYSAGAYSVFYQLAYDVHLPDDKAIVKQACIWSNGPATQPKSPAAAQVQFNQILSALNIPVALPWAEKLFRLRSVTSQDLISAAVGVDLNQFRPTSDSVFIPNSLFKSFDNGNFGRRVAARSIRIMLGECQDERFLYATWFPPHKGLLSLHKRLLADYPRPIVDTLMKLYYPEGKLPSDCQDWHNDAFGRVYADMQVHNTQRGLVHSLALGGAAHLLYRYRIEYRLKCADKSIPPDWGVTHATDQYIWFWGNGETIEPREKLIIKRGLIDPWIKFVHGEPDIDWGTRNHWEIRTLKPDGSVQIWQDGFWEEAMRVWKALREVGESDEIVEEAKL